ncbi:DsbA family protein [Hazenella sp. IB182357]|uniref:DsbA family protein n=1 Tax=Polycladospora coralii TaxID=2771432 RepID=A0A926RUN9_9BACL|nr:DsbA family protein [Polycladospora coralii]MBD1372812.1 DsbA family protein [Polycladospora coralii]
MPSKNQRNKANKSKDLLQIIILVTVLVGFIGVIAFAYLSKDSESVKQAETQISYEGQPMIGDANAPVKVMEFGDYKCPSCKEFHDSIYPQLKKDYIDTGKVQFYFTNYQFLGEDSITAGIGGESVFKQNPSAFWKYYDVVYANQQDKHTEWATPEFLTDLIKKNIPEVDAEQVKKDMENKTYLKDVEADNEMAVTNNIQRVPSIVINGKVLENGLDYENIKKVIEEELNQK